MYLNIFITGIFVLLLVGTGFVKSPHQQEFTMDPVYVETPTDAEPVFVDETIQVLNLDDPLEELLNTIPFDDELVIELEADDGVEKCVDTYLRSDVTCADKEAIIKLRNLQMDEEIENERLEEEKEELEEYYDEHGLMEC